MRPGVWGVEIRSLIVANVSSARRQLMMPASNMKILTVGGAAETPAGTIAPRRRSKRPERSRMACCGPVGARAIPRSILFGPRSPRSTSGSAHSRPRGYAGSTAASSATIRRRRRGGRGRLGPDYLQRLRCAGRGAQRRRRRCAGGDAGSNSGRPRRDPSRNGSGLVVLNRGWTAAAGTETTRLPSPPRTTAARNHGRDRLGASAVTRTVAVVNPTPFFTQSRRTVGGARHRRDGSRRRLR